MAENKAEPFQSLDSVISSTISVGLTPSQIRKHLFTPKELAKLAHTLPDYYRKMRLPPKSDGELRPYISPKLAGRKLGITTVVSDPSEFNQSIGFTEMTKNIKKYLLYCHSICIHDPLQYLLDFFAFNPYGDISVSYLPMVNSLFIEYAKLGKLIKDRIVIPISDEKFGIWPDVSVTSEEQDYLKAQLPELKDVAGFLGSVITDQQARISFLENRADLFLTHQDFVTVLGKLLQFYETRFASRQILEPFKAAILGEISVINPDEVSIDDIVRMRRNDELFAKFRDTFGRILAELYDPNSTYTDLDGEFKGKVKDELAKWKDEVSIQKKKSPYMKKILESSDKVLIGAIGGGITGFALGGPAGASIGAIAAGGIPPAIEAIRDFLRVAWDHSENATLRRHFLAIQND